MKFILGLLKWSFFTFCTLMLIGGMAAHHTQENKAVSMGLIVFFALWVLGTLAITIVKRVKKRKSIVHPEYQPFYRVVEEEPEPKSLGKVLFDVIKWIFIVVKWVIFAMFALALTDGERLYLEGEFDVLAICGVYVAVVLFYAIYSRKKKRREAEEKLAEANPWQYYSGEDAGEIK